MPAGIAISGSGGTISGTPTAASAKTSYTVTASNNGGSTTASLTITVNGVAPSNLSYPQATIQATVSTTIAADTPTVTGTVSSYAISPALPAGLSIDATSGAISGTPTAASARTTYTITATNAGGNTTAQVQITVLNGPSQLAFLGHTETLMALQTDGATVLSSDFFGRWVLWGYASAGVIASGSGVETRDTKGIALAGPTAVVWDGTNATLYSTANGQMIAAVPAACWYKLATDGSYVAVGSPSALTVYSSSGAQEFTQTGNYCAANVFAAPSQVQVALGAKGNNVIENLAVPAGTSTVSLSFNGTFNSWFTDGQRFLSAVSTTILAYSVNAVQQGIMSLPAGAAVVAGQGNWISVLSGNHLSIYAVGSSTPAQTFNAAGEEVPSGLELASISEYSQQLSVIDLSGATPIKTDYTLPAPLYPVNAIPPSIPTPFAASSASTWLLACNNNVIFDGASINSTPRTLNYGAALSIVAAGNTAAVATESGQILVFDLTVPKAIGNISFYANKLAITSDGSVLAAADLDVTAQPDTTLNFYSLPSMALTGSQMWNINSPPFLGDFSLSASGTEVGVLMIPGGDADLMHPDGSSNVVLQQGAQLAPLLSPDGTLAAVTSPLPWLLGAPLPTTNVYQNGTLSSAESGFAEGWIDDNDLLIANFQYLGQMGNPGPTYMGSTIDSASGSTVTTFAPSQLPYSPGAPTFIPGGSVYFPGTGALGTNAIYSLTTGTLVFQGPSNSQGQGAATASDIVYESTNGVVTIVPFR